jgi:hypothetical protein
MMFFIGILLLCILLCAYSKKIVKEVVFFVQDNMLTIENGYVRSVFNTSSSPWMSELYGDFQGQSSFSDNLLSSNGFRLERENDDGSFTSAIGANKVFARPTVRSSQRSSCVEANFPEVYDDAETPAVREKWIFTLCNGDRSLHFRAAGEVVPSSRALKMRSVTHSLYTTPVSTTSFFEDGVVQIKSAETSFSHFASTSKMPRAYFLGEHGAVDVLRPSATGGTQDQVVMLNFEEGGSGMREIVVGRFQHTDYWCEGSSADDAQVPFCWFSNPFTFAS